MILPCLLKSWPAANHYPVAKVEKMINNRCVASTSLCLSSVPSKLNEGARTKGERDEIGHIDAPGYARHWMFCWLDWPVNGHSWICQAPNVPIGGARYWPFLDKPGTGHSCTGKALAVPAGHARYWPFLNTPDLDRCQISLAQAVTAKTGQAMIVRNRLINLPGGDTSWR